MPDRNRIQTQIGTSETLKFSGTTVNMNDDAALLIQ